MNRKGYQGYKYTAVYGIGEQSSAYRVIRVIRYIYIYRVTGVFELGISGLLGLLRILGLLGLLIYLITTPHNMYIYIFIDIYIL